MMGGVGVEPLLHPLRLPLLGGFLGDRALSPLLCLTGGQHLTGAVLQPYRVEQFAVDHLDVVLGRLAGSTTRQIEQAGRTGLAHVEHAGELQLLCHDLDGRQPERNVRG